MKRWMLVLLLAGCGSGNPECDRFAREVVTPESAFCFDCHEPCAYQESPYAGGCMSCH